MFHPNNPNMSSYTFEIEFDEYFTTTLCVQKDGKRFLKRSFPVHFNKDFRFYLSENGEEITDRQVQEFVGDIKNNRSSNLTIMGVNGSETISYSHVEKEIVFSMNNRSSGMDVFISVEEDDDRIDWADGFEGFFNEIKKEYNHINGNESIYVTHSRNGEEYTEVHTVHRIPDGSNIDKNLFNELVNLGIWEF